MYRSVLSIHIPIEVKEMSLEALINSGGKWDFISTWIVEERKLPTVPIKPVHIGQALEVSDRAIVDQKIYSHVHFMMKNYSTQEKVDFLFTLLKRDVGLEMPILKREKILIDTATYDIWVPKTNAEIKVTSATITLTVALHFKSNMYLSQLKTFTYSSSNVGGLRN